MPRTPYTAREKDACAIIAYVDKRGRATHANIIKTIEALKKMAHRSGDINDEGDGCGVLTDIPTAIWGERLQEAGLSPHLAESRSFFVGHFLLPFYARKDESSMLETVRGVMADHGVEILVETLGKTRDAELGPLARAEAPLFWQVGCMLRENDRQQGRSQLFALQIAIEKAASDLHVSSLSFDSAVYKVRGIPDLLPRVYPELLDPRTRSVITLGHSRYSTNTLPTVERSQPFSMLGHNGEINTIERLRSSGRTLGIEPAPGGSDSQDLNRIIEGLINLHGFHPMEALEMVFPAIHTQVASYSDDLARVYDFFRWFFPPSAQGPAAVVSRYGNLCLGSVDALGLRPLWFGESDYDYFLSSEKGVVDLEQTIGDPRPLAPGEKIAIVSGRGRRAEVLDYGAIQTRLVRFMKGRFNSEDFPGTLYRSLPPLPASPDTDNACLPSRPETAGTTNGLKGFGWQQYDLDMRRTVARSGIGVIGSMGYQGPLACINHQALPPVSEFFKENVAVVTNPAIDREREAEHFSTRVILGKRPSAGRETGPSAVGLELRTPVLFGCPSTPELLEVHRETAHAHGTLLMEEVLRFFTAEGKDPVRTATLDCTFDPEQDLEEQIEKLCANGSEAILRGGVILVLDDSTSFADGRVFLDPGLATAALGRRLEKSGLRRNCSIVVRSGAVRNLHDIMFLLGLGADAVVPDLIWETALMFTDDTLDAGQALSNTMDALQKGIEKVMSTMGIHELCGYGRIFSSIGLGRDLSGWFSCRNFCTGEVNGLTLAGLREMGRTRYATATASKTHNLWKAPRRNPRAGRILRSVAVGKTGYVQMKEALAELDDSSPTGLRHLLGFVPGDGSPRPALEEIDISVGDHSMPLIISAMSFGSQGENSFRSYAEAARKVNIVCMNGEGGEIPDMLGRYRRNRGQQVASGRFGVSMELLNSADFLEIKVGQGAKPGEGGHLPGTKVTEMVAAARHCKPGVTLISPSNHHDIYSIEDLTQIITELKTANPFARISIKIPVTSGVGTIAVGVAKAGAHIVNISGFDGGTGAAREHAKKYVGLPVEIGVTQAHRALVESGLRNRVEIWCDGGIRSGSDVVKMVLLGADRVGLGTVALMGVGCISCEKCHLDRCPRGISTQIRTRAEAKQRGVHNFSPVQVAMESENLARLLNAMGDEIRSVLADLGQVHLRSLVGRVDLLSQTNRREEVDCAELLQPAPRDASSCCPHPRRVRKPLNYLTRLVSDLAMDKFRDGSSVITFTDENVRSVDRAMGTHLAGAMVREFTAENRPRAMLHLGSSVPGNGLCAFNVRGIDTVVQGGAQDGIAKGSLGGSLGILKGINFLGHRVDGSAGKSCAYGAIQGTIMVQNYADSRACIRMSGADAVFGARITEPIRDEEGNIAIRAHLKGFAFEYMTGGRAVVLGDPGPWMCAGMTGGVIYQCLYPELGFTEEALSRRFATGASVKIRKISREGTLEVQKLLEKYIEELRRSFQDDEGDAVQRLADEAEERFVMIVPKSVTPKTSE
jgi:glutamate synthase (NADPH/NADH) large chain